MLGLRGYIIPVTTTTMPSFKILKESYWLSILLKFEEDFLRTKSRINWIIHGDANTRFFHTSTINRKRRNKICSHENDMGQTLQDKDDISAHVQSHFSTLFFTSLHQSLLKVKVILTVPISSPMRITSSLTFPLEILIFLEPLDPSALSKLHPLFY